MTLCISLKRGETIVVNGAVLQAASRTDLRLANRASILRGSEVMTPEQATTPAARLYFATMLAYIDAEGLEGHRQAIIEQFEEVVGGAGDDETRATCLRFARHAATDQYYLALGECRDLMAREMPGEIPGEMPGSDAALTLHAA